MADQVIRNYKKPVGTSSKDSKADIARAKFKQAQKEGNVQKNEVPFGPGGVAKAAGKIVAKVAEVVKGGSEERAIARGLKAANKPTNKTGNIADRQQRADLVNQANLIKNADPARPNRVRGGSLHSMKTYGGVGDVAGAMKKSSAKNIAHQIEISKELNPVRKIK